MQIYSDKLYEKLKNNIDSIFLVAGDEILQRNESCDLIRSFCFKNDYNERQRYTLESKFNWSSFRENLNTLSLFSHRRLIELDITDGKINSLGSEIIYDFCQNPPSDTVLLINSKRIEGNPKWLKAIIEVGVYIPIYPLDSNRLPKWLNKRAASLNLKLSYDAAELLASKVEGNLMAANQELEKLSLLVPKNSLINRNLISKTVADNSKISTFECFDAAMVGDTLSACRALRNIKDEGIEPSPIIGALAYLLRNISQLKKFSNENNLNQGVKTLRIHKKKQKGFIKTISHLKIEEITKLTSLCSKADIQSKTINKEESWLIIEIILVYLSQKKISLDVHLENKLNF